MAHVPSPVPTLHLLQNSLTFNLTHSREIIIMAKRIEKDKGKFKTLIANTIKDGAAFKDKLQRALSSACWHALMHGDVTGLNELIKNTNDLVGNNAHKRWVVLNADAYLRWTNEEGGFAIKDAANEIRKVPEACQAHEERLETAKPYYQATKPPSFDGMSVIGMLNAIVKKHENIERKKAETMELVGISEEDFNGKLDLRGLHQVKRLLANLQASGAMDEPPGNAGTADADGGATVYLN